MILLNEEETNLIAGMAESAADMLECNCALPACEGTCTHAEAKKVLEMLVRKEEGQKSPQAKAYREGAIPKTTAGEIEVDDESIVSFSEDGGSYVQAWIWVESEDAGICRKCGEFNAGKAWDGLCINCSDKADKEAAD